MEIIYDSHASYRTCSALGKPLDNAAQSKPKYASDEECARLLADVLRDVPEHLNGDPRSSVPLLAALRELDASCDTDLAKRLLLVAAANHRNADERWTAEYLLRNRATVTTGRRAPLSLLLAARCAAEMHVRRQEHRESAMPREALVLLAHQPPVHRDDPSVGEVVLAKLQAATGFESMTERCADAVRDAVSVALALAERHHVNPRSCGPSLIAMRADARPDARLSAHLRAEFGDAAIAGRLARLLVGPEGSPIDTALLWWCARQDFAAASIPEDVRHRWLRDIQAVDNAIRGLGFRNLPGVSSKTRHSGWLASSRKSPTCSPSQVSGPSQEGRVAG